MNFDKFFLKAIEQGVSDIHFKVGRPPIVRLFGDLFVVKGAPLQSEDITNLVFSLLAQAKGKHLRSFTEIDTTYSIPGKARFRVNIYKSRGEYAIAMRYIPLEIPSLDDLRVPTPIRGPLVDHEVSCLLQELQAPGKQRHWHQQFSL